jgi:hypothetical protein
MEINMRIVNNDVSDQLIQRFKDGKVALFIGAGCSMSAGLPGWKDLLLSMRDLYEANHLIDGNAKGLLKRWFKSYDDFPRIASFFKRQSPDIYRTYLQGLFDPDLPKKALRPPEYFYFFQNLSVTRIITTNFDKMLEDSLIGWNSITWQDKEEMPRYLRENRKVVYHIHGKADRFGTLVHTLEGYNDLKGTNGAGAREFLKTIFETHTILVIGYRLGDPVIQWIIDSLLADWDRNPEWYLLCCDPGLEEFERERADRNLGLIPYKIDKELNPSKAHEKAISSWFKGLAEKLGLDYPERSDTGDKPYFNHDWLEINSHFLGKQSQITPVMREGFYRGTDPTWLLVKEGLTARRKATDEILKIIQGDGFQAILIKAAGGEGKTTVLMQVAIDLSHKGFKVLFSTDPGSDPYAMLKKNKGPLVLMFDHSDQIQRLSSLLSVASNRKQKTVIILASRINEWNNNQKTIRNDLRFLSEIRLKKLDMEEATDIARLLIEAGMGIDSDEAAFARRLLNDSNGFLLAAMLTATRGESLARILEDVVRKVWEWDDGEELLRALGFVVALESRKNKKGDHMFCSQRLFQEALEKSKQQALRICYQMEGEISLRPRGGYRVETRHPVIAETLFPILFSKSRPILDELDIHERLLHSAGRLSREHIKAGERKLLTILPNWYKKRKDYQTAGQLFKAASEADPGNALIWQAWALMEKDQGNPGDVGTKYSARWLFRKGTEADPGHVSTWQAWAMMEKDQRNPGDVGTKYSARWLFRKGTEADPGNAPTWQAWALMEKDQGNTGDVETEYSARWLFRKGTEADPGHAPVWQAWAMMEKDQGNIGDV